MCVQGRYQLTLEQLKYIVESDEKGRYRFNPDQSRIKACQGHSIPWVEPELLIMEPPKFLYHGTHVEALERIMESGAISKMERHAVHLQAESGKAWTSARRWKEKNRLYLKSQLNNYTSMEWSSAVPTMVYGAASKFHALILPNYYGIRGTGKSTRFFFAFQQGIP